MTTPPHVPITVLGPVLGRGTYGVVHEKSYDPSTVIKCGSLFFNRLSMKLINEIQTSQKTQLTQLKMEGRASSQSSSHPALSATPTEPILLVDPRQSSRTVLNIAAATIKEIAVLAQFPHPNIIPLQGDFFYIDGAPDQVAFAMPKYSKTVYEWGRDATSLDHTTFVKHLLVILRDVSQGLQHLHDHNIQHGDLKPENMMYDSHKQHAVLIDLGGAVLAPQSRRAHQNGCTYLYESFETLNTSSTPCFCNANDLWSLGMMTVMLLLGNHAPWVVLPNGHTHVKHEDPHFRSALFTFYQQVRKQSNLPYLCFNYLFSPSSPSIDFDGGLLNGARSEERMARFNALPEGVVDMLRRMLMFDHTLRPSMRTIAETCRTLLGQHCAVTRPLTPKQEPRYHPRLTDFRYMKALGIDLWARSFVIQRLWNYISEMDRLEYQRVLHVRAQTAHAVQASAASPRRGPFPQQVLPESPLSGFQAFVGGVHIFDYYCANKTTKFTGIHELQAALFVAFQLSCHIVFLNDYRVDLASLYAASAEEQACLSRYGSPFLPVASQSRSSPPSPMQRAASAGVAQSPAPQTVIVPTNLDRFLLKMRDITKDIIWVSKGMLLEKTFYNARTMKSSEILLSLVTRDDYYTRSDEENVERYDRLVARTSSMYWFNSEAPALSQHDAGAVSRDQHASSSSPERSPPPSHSPPPTSMSALFTAPQDTAVHRPHGYPVVDYINPCMPITPVVVIPTSQADGGGPPCTSPVGSEIFRKIMESSPRSSTPSSENAKTNEQAFSFPMVSSIGRHSFSSRVSAEPSRRSSSSISEHMNDDDHDGDRSSRSPSQLTYAFGAVTTTLTPPFDGTSPLIVSSCPPMKSAVASSNIHWGMGEPVGIPLARPSHSRAVSTPMQRTLFCTPTKRRAGMHGSLSNEELQLQSAAPSAFSDITQMEHSMSNMNPHTPLVQPTHSTTPTTAAYGAPGGPRMNRGRVALPRTESAAASAYAAHNLRQRPTIPARLPPQDAAPNTDADMNGRNLPM
jgi:serine/threonine protein kinase